MKYHPIIVFISLLMVSACKKDSSDPKDLLVSKTWRPSLKDRSQDTNPAAAEILYYAVQECEKDDTYRFQTDGKLIKASGTQKCADNQPVSETLDYNMDVGSGQISVNGIKYKLLDLSENQLKYSAPLPGGKSIVYIFEH